MNRSTISEHLFFWEWDEACYFQLRETFRKVNGFKRNTNHNWDVNKVWNLVHRFINYALLYLAIPSWVLNHTEWVITSWILVVNPALCVHIKVCTCLSIRWNQLWKSDYGFSNWLITIAVWKWCYLLKVIRSRNKNCRAVTSPKKEKNIFFLSWWLGNTWNLKSKFNFTSENFQPHCGPVLSKRSSHFSSNSLVGMLLSRCCAFWNPADRWGHLPEKLPES